MKRSYVYPMMLALLMVGSACSQKMKFNGAPSTDNAVKNVPDAPVCEPGQTTVSKPTKFIMVVDQSGSNFDGPYEHPGQGTDVDKTLRYGAIAEFLLLYGQNTNYSWSFITFAGTGAKALINDGVSNQDPTFGQYQQMSAALETFRSSTDSGNTPYLSAMTMVQNLIAADLAKGVSPDTQYRIAFLTDGYPTDYPAGAQLESSIDQGIASILNLAPNAIQFSTVYYGFPDTTASGRLQRMATEGKGSFLDSGRSGSLNLDNVIQVPKTTCQ